MAPQRIALVPTFSAEHTLAAFQVTVLYMPHSSDSGKVMSLHTHGQDLVTSKWLKPGP